MKLPHKADPGGDAEGALLRADVLEVLFRNGVKVTPREEGGALLEKGDVLEFQYLPDLVGGRMIRYLGRKFDIPVTDFYTARKSKIH